MRERTLAGLAEGGVGGFSGPQLSICLVLPCQARLEDTKEKPQKTSKWWGVAGEGVRVRGQGVPKISNG